MPSLPLPRPFRPPFRASALLGALLVAAGWLVHAQRHLPASPASQPVPHPAPTAFAAVAPGAPPADPGQEAGPRGGRGRSGPRGGGGGGGGGGFPGFGGGMGQRDPRAGVPEWTNNPTFDADVFTLVRLKYRSAGRGGWRVDYPGADLNLSYRLQRLSSIRVAPDPLALDIDDPELFLHPFAVMIDPRSLTLSREEAEILRKYLLGGGFLLVDDFWGQQMWSHLVEEFSKVFPDRQWVSLPFDHPIFNVPYKLPYKPQVPSEDSAHATKDRPDPWRTWEFEITWEEPQPPDYRAFLDDKGRIMMLVCLNTDLSDGWEEEGVSQWFFENYSEKLSYPMGINIIYHVLTH